MGLLKIFTGKSPADYERTGDAMAADKAWGDAKLAFESALDKLAKQSPADPAMHHRLLQKLHHSKDSLAEAQRKEAMALMDNDCVNEALELFALALELTSNPQLKSKLTQQIQSARQARPGAQDQTVVSHSRPDEPEVDASIDDAENYFDVLLGTLPDAIQQAYRGYGYNFKQGYLALNQGAFDQAVVYLRQAAEENPSVQSLVPLELATAYMNLGRTQSAQRLLETLVQHQPDLLPAIQMLCESYWDAQNFDQAMQLLDTLVPELAQSMGAYQLRGETLLQAARYDEAKSFFQELLKTYGWHEIIATGLARAFEGLDQIPQARDVYGELISQCSGCGTRIDPSVKRKFADLSLATGDYSPKVLAYYISLSQEDPANAVQYFQNISRIYLEMGNKTEARRFQFIAEALAREQKPAL